MEKIPELGVVDHVVLVVGTSIVVKTRRHRPRIPVRDRHRLHVAGGRGTVDGRRGCIEINGPGPYTVISHREREVAANLIAARGRRTAHRGIGKGRGRGREEGESHGDRGRGCPGLFLFLKCEFHVVVLEGWHEGGEKTKDGVGGLGYRGQPKVSEDRRGGMGGRRKEEGGRFVEKAERKEGRGEEGKENDKPTRREEKDKRKRTLRYLSTTINHPPRRPSPAFISSREREDRERMRAKRLLLARGAGTEREDVLEVESKLLLLYRARCLVHPSPNA